MTDDVANVVCFAENISCPLIASRASPGRSKMQKGGYRGGFLLVWCAEQAEEVKQPSKSSQI